MKIKNLVYFFVVALLFSCSEKEARRPVSKKKSYTLAATSEQMKKINKIEEAKVLTYIENDSLKTYTSSPSGFWYQYVQKVEIDSVRPKKGDVVLLSYEILDLKDQVIYAKEELGVKEYKVDKEDFIPALQQGIKLMKSGETMKFVIPSYNAFGVVGDNNKIGINESIISIVTLINIRK
jgi:gliding motility-associated peptidyl-prolyl isomerase